MRELELPQSVSSLIDNLHVVQFVWQGIELQLPKFSVYSVIDQPVFDRKIVRNGRRMALVKLGRYDIPVIDPFRGHIDEQPNHLVIISHSKGNRFGLYAYPADYLGEEMHIPVYHRSVNRIVKDFV